MAVSRVQPGDFSLNQVMTSAQATQLDKNIVLVSQANDTTNAKLDALAVGSEGVRRLRESVDMTAAIALTDHNTGDYLFVRGLGLYRYDGTLNHSLLAPLNPLTFIRPTDRIGPGTGLWVWQMQSVNQAYGVPRLDANVRLPAAMPINGIINHLVDFSTSHAATAASASLVDVAGTTITVPLAANNDKISVQYSLATIVGSTATGTMNFLVQVNLGAGWVNFGRNYVMTVVNGVVNPIHVKAAGVIAGLTGTLQLKLQWSCNNSNSIPANSLGYELLHTRPA